TASAATAAGSPTATGRCSATIPVPALPGAQTSAVTAGSAASARHSACSRAPPPTTRTRTGARVPARGQDGRAVPADADRRRPSLGSGLEEVLRLGDGLPQAVEQRYADQRPAEDQPYLHRH